MHATMQLSNELLQSHRGGFVATTDCYSQDIGIFFLGWGGGVYVSFLCSGLITESYWEVSLDAFGAPPGCAGFWVLALVVGDANGGEVRES